MNANTFLYSSLVLGECSIRILYLLANGQLTDEDLSQFHQMLDNPDFQTHSLVSGISHDYTSSTVMLNNTNNKYVHI